MLPGSVMINNILKNAKYYLFFYCYTIMRCIGGWADAQELPFQFKKKNKITISLTYAWLRNNNFRGGGSSLNFSEGDQTLPTTSLDPRTFHIYIFFYKSNKVIIIENWTVSHCAVLLNYLKVYVEREVTLAKNFRTVYALFHTLLPSNTSVAAA